MLVNYPQCTSKKGVLVLLHAQALAVEVDMIVKKHLVHMD